MFDVKFAAILFITEISISTSLNLKNFKQPDDILFNSKYDYLENAAGTNLCTRICDGKPKICYYEFYPENYATMGPACEKCPYNATACLNPQCVTGDGVERHIATYNRLLPGPLIQVCAGDKIVVDVHNKLIDTSTSIHWHGIRQKGSQYYDGVPLVTQCPIDPGNTFRYIFQPSDPGTYFYHDHIGFDNVDGLSGPLIVREQKSKEFYGNLYDYDLPSHVVFIKDWMHVAGISKIPGFRYHNPSQNAVSYLINGKGVFLPTNTTANTNETNNLPLAEFVVQKGKRYRFRVIGGLSLSCTVTVRIHNHRLTLISADSGGPITPTPVDSFILNSGDRFDFILNANQTVNSYWIHARGNGECTKAQQFAILRYEGHKGKERNFPKYFRSTKDERTLNPGKSFCNKKSDLCLSNLKAPMKRQVSSAGRKKEKFFLSFNFYSYSVPELYQNNDFKPFWVPISPTPFESYLYLSTLENISFRFPTSPLLSQYFDIPESEYCPEECYQQIDNRQPCHCLNLLKVPLNSEVTMIITDFGQYSAGEFIPDGLVHPFHLHGHNFYILEQGRFDLDGKSLQEQARHLKKRLEEDDFEIGYAVSKDVVSVPTSGYVVIRWIADNPGFWLMHCHFTYHLDLGMAAVIQVGELTDMPPVPPGFPKCSDYRPPVTPL